MSDTALTPENIEAIARSLAGDKFDEHGWSCRHQALDSIMELRKMEQERYKIDADLEAKRLAASQPDDLAGRVDALEREDKLQVTWNDKRLRSILDLEDLAARHDAAIAEYLLRLQAVEELTRDTRGRSNADGMAISVLIEKYDAELVALRETLSAAIESGSAVEHRVWLIEHPDIPRDDDDTNFEQVGRLSPHSSIPVTITVDQPARDDYETLSDDEIVARNRAEYDAVRDDAAQGDQREKLAESLFTHWAINTSYERGKWEELSTSKQKMWRTLSDRHLSNAIALGLVTALEGEADMRRLVKAAQYFDIPGRYRTRSVEDLHDALRPFLTPIADAEGEGE